MQKKIQQVLKKFDENLPQKDINLIVKKLQLIQLKKNDYFLKIGENNAKIGLLISGVLLATYVSNNEKQYVARIYSLENGNTIISNHESFFFNTPSTENITAIEDCLIMCIDKKELNLLMNNHISIDNLVRKIAEYSYVSLTKRTRELQSLSAFDRVKNYYLLYKTLFNRVKKKDMASYLAINRNEFTKILKQL